MGFNPREKTVIEFFQNHHIMLIIRFHFLPAFEIIIHTPQPQFMPPMLDLRSNIKGLDDVIQFIGDKFKLPSCHLEKVNLL
jgi:hypothetical protein